TIEDELTLTRGDSVITQDHYWDGWALGANLTTQQKGVFPIGVTSPLNGPHSRLTLINAARSPDDLLGLELLEAAMLAHPGSIEVHHFCAEGIAEDGACARPNVVGVLYPRRLDKAAIAEVLSAQEGQDLPAPMVVVCGPPGFDAHAVDALDEAGIEAVVVKVLPADRVLEVNIASAARQGRAPPPARGLETQVGSAADVFPADGVAENGVSSAGGR
ncbi:hypothetical protein BDK51DRAFT_49549, partial [Blyttiomyces helicus]